jgi:hypothetical protein
MATQTGAAQRRRLPAPDMLVAVFASIQVFAVI